MPIAFRELNPDHELAFIGATLGQHFAAEPNIADPARLQWLYQQNATGQALVVLAEDEKGHAVGASSAFARDLRTQKGPVRGYVLGDFCVAEECRSLGPALALQRSTVRKIESAGAGLYFDFPSDGMLAIYRRMGARQLSGTRLALPLRVDKKVSQRVSFGPAARMITTVANAALRQMQRRASTSDMRIAEESGFGQEFTLLAEAIGTRHGACVFRSSDYLTYRFKRHPKHAYRLLTARTDGKLLGYVILRGDKGRAIVADMFGHEFETISSLLGAAAESLRSEYETLTVSLPDEHPWCTALQSLGFRKRAHFPIVVGGSAVADCEPLLLMHGDRES
jgi:predicted N-acetyltransferase YhbS